jgi:hypothetical protein
MGDNIITPMYTHNKYNTTKDRYKQYFLNLQM